MEGDQSPQFLADLVQELVQGAALWGLRTL